MIALLTFRVGPLASGKITIHFLNVLEDRHTRKGFDNVEHFLNLRLQVDKRSLTAAVFELFSGRGKDAQPGAADKL
jgi:hypothetical protein